MRNRLSSTESRNKRDMGRVVEQLARRIGFRVAPGFGDRVIYRELFLKGLTLLDLRDSNTGIPLSMSHVAARHEVRALLEVLRLPASGQRRNQALAPSVRPGGLEFAAIATMFLERPAHSGAADFAAWRVRTAMGHLHDKNRRETLPTGTKSADVSAFLEQVKRTPARVGARQAGRARGRLIFALDATASREPTWDMACHIQNRMFEATAALGTLAVQLVFYRGFGECKASGWLESSAELVRRMEAVRCLAGRTQIMRVLGHAISQARSGKVDALIFVGDCVEEDIDALAHKAGELGLLGVPVFVFHEGGDPVAARAFRHIAHLTGGACFPFDLSSPDRLRELLAAVAIYAVGGHAALEAHQGAGQEAVRLLTDQMRRGRGGAGGGADRGRKP